MIDLDSLMTRLGGVYSFADDDTLVPMNENEIAAIEKKCKGTISDSYRRFLLKYGACGFKESVECQARVKLPKNLSDNRFIGFGFFFGAASPKYDDGFQLIRTINVFKDRMPTSIIPIGEDSGNKICIGISGDVLGKVYYWDHNNEWDEEDYEEEHGRPMPPEMKFQNLHLLGESFDDFLSRLRNVK